MLLWYFDQTGLGPFFGSSLGSAPMNYLQIYGPDIHYANANPTRVPVVVSGTSVMLNARELLSLANEAILTIAEHLAGGTVWRTVVSMSGAKPRLAAGTLRRRPVRGRLPESAEYFDLAGLYTWSEKGAKMEIPAYRLSGLVVALSLMTPVPSAFAQRTPPLQIKSFSVGPDQTLSYPKSLVNLPDEHTTFMPPASPAGPYLLFGASNISGSQFGAVVLQTTDLVNFDFATALGYAQQVMTGPVPMLGQCNPAYVTEFDGNYAAPGSVVQDPTLPPGNFIMIYEAENHCPGGVFNVPFYATAGFARSSDSGKTWPAPINGILGGPARHPVVQSSDPQPSIAHGSEGDALPSAFVDLGADGNYYLYVSYAYLPASGNDDGRIRVARAKLGVDPLNFEKWYNGSFSQPGIGGSDTGVTPSTGCGGGQTHSEINYNDDLGLYLLIVVCANTSSRVGAWYYSTATSLDLEDWTTPQMIQNSQFPLTTPCPGKTDGDQFDGLYPSTVSPGAAAGHTKLTGYFFFLNGCGVGARQFMSRTFTIVAAPTAFFTGEVSLGSGVYYLEFPDNNLFGYYNFVSSSIFYHYDMGFEAFVPGSAADIYLYDFTSSHWWYTSAALFPYLYDFTLKNWLYYFPDTKNPGHYTTNPRYFSNLTTGKIFTL